MKLVKFTKPALPYGAGDVAGFPDGQADRYIAAGVGVAHTPKQKQKAAAPKPAAATPPASADKPAQPQGQSAGVADDLKTRDNTSG